MRDGYVLVPCSRCGEPLLRERGTTEATHWRDSCYLDAMISGFPPLPGPAEPFTTCAPLAEWITPADIGMQLSVSAEDFRAELDRLGIRSRADL